MREHLYCGKRVDNGEWVEGFYAEPTRHWHKYGIHKAWIITGAFQNGGLFNVMGRHAVLPETVCEYTGLTDKNGKKIFEGYIVKARHNDRPYLVSFVDGSFNIQDKYGCIITTTQEAIDRFEVEIVGNIHDNPELLEEK